MVLSHGEGTNTHQISRYSELIQRNPSWEYAGVFADYGISGTSTERPEFQRLMAECEAGRIDIVLTKSLSRFARNTLDTLVTVRHLKELGIAVRFEKENIDTMTAKGELLLTLLASFAQEESRSISENCTWGQRKRMADGRVSVPFDHFLGYDRGEHGELVINKEQAKTVMLIYELFLQGLTPHAIAKRLTEMGIPTPRKKTKWNQGTVRSILTNEKYKGDALMQKCYTENFITKRQLVNNGELLQYYVEGNHEAIIAPETFELVEQEMTRRKAKNGRYSGVDIFASRLVYGECDAYFGAKVWHSNSQYRRVIYRCNRKYAKGHTCSTPHFTDDEIKARFITALNKLLHCKDEVIANLEAMNKRLFNNTESETQSQRLLDEMEAVEEMIHRAISENARIALDQEAYNRRFDELSEKYEALKRQRDEAEKEIADRLSRRAAMSQFMNALNKQPALVAEFDPVLWGILLDHVTIHTKNDVRFTFKDGTEISA